MTALTRRRQQPKLLGTTENALGLRDYCKEKGIEYVVTDDKEGPNSEFQKHIVDAEYVSHFSCTGRR